MRVAALVMSSLMVFACTGESSLERPGEPGGPVNQFRSRSQQALTLPDGGQCPISVNADAELMIRNLAVVEDPLRTNWSGNLANPSDGAWHFGRLMTTMAGPNDPELFVRNWLAQWDSPRLVNGLNVAPRPMNAIVTQPWLAASGGTRLDLTRAPFRLLAIVNRMDLRNLSRGSAGEGRFVFGVLGAGGTQLQFTVILEFNLPATTQADVDRWAADWHALGTLPVGSPAFNTALEAITNRFAGPNASPTRPNGSAINQVRSNEIALTAPWEMREFNLNAAGQLVQVPVAQTTDLPLNNTPNLAQFINTNTAALLTDTHVVPATFNGAPFLAGSALTNPGHFWNAPGITNPDARFHFSVNTCNGCHAGDTNTAFLHVAPRNAGQVAQLSGFLTGTVVPDRVTGAPRTFNDLSVRSESLLAVLCRVPTSTASVTITSPAAGATLRGPSTLTASATGVTAVQFLVDGSPVSPPVSAPFTAPFNADTVPPGPHTLTAVGTSATGPITSAPVAFTTAPSVGPDFTVTITSAPSIVAPGESFTTQVNVCNLGTVGGSTSVELFLSADNVITSPRNGPADFFVGAAPVSLVAGECKPVTIQGSATTPPGATQPAVFIGAMVDSFGNVVETNEANNTSAVQAIAVGQGPDFVVTSAKGPVAVLPGASFTVSVTTCNRGNVTATTDVEVMASTDTTLALPQDFFLGALSRLTLTPSQCVTSSVNTFSPPSGTWFIGAVATRGGFELITTNNASPASRLDVGTLPDFTVSSVSSAASALPGAAFNGSAVLCNNGTVDGVVQAFVVLASSRTLSPDLFSPTNSVVGSFSLSLLAGRCVSQSFTAQANPPAGVIAPFVGIVLDSTNAVTEFNETNNQLAATTAMGVGSMPDFQVTGVSAPAALLPGAPFIATVSVCNRGTVPASTEVELRLSSGATSMPVGQAPTPTLNANQCGTVSVSGAANPVVPGQPSFNLNAVADPRSVVPEFIETNNTSPAFSMAIGSAPDFTVTSIGVPSVIAPFEPFTASITVCNRGTAPGGAQVDLVLSSDATISVPGDTQVPGAFFTLAANQCLTQTVQATMNANAPPPPPGSLTMPFFIAAIADPFNSMAELRETNNSFVRSFQLGRGPDFVVSTATAPASVTFGASFASNVTVCNRGNAPATSTISFLISSDTVISTSNPIGANDVLVPAMGDLSFPLAPGACATRPYTVNAFTPGGARGQFFMGVVVDLNQSLPELIETNNLSPIRAISVL